MAFYSFSIARKDQLKNIIVGLIFFFLAIRVSKSVLWAFWDAAPLWLINIGFAAHLAVGPLFLLYTMLQLDLKAKLVKWNFVHLIPSLLVLFLMTEIQLGNFWYVGGYTALLYHQLVYMGLSALLIGLIAYQNKGLKAIPKKSLLWVGNLWLGITTWGLAYFLNYVVGITSYLLGPVLYSVVIYVLSFYALRHQDIFKKKSSKYSNLKLSRSQLSQYKEKILSAMDQSKPYLDADFTLTKLSELVAIPSHILSHVINDEIKTNYSEFINSYRIAEARERLEDPGNNHLKIASVAYDCGFNSMSAFNTAFKKIAGTTPSQYRNKFHPVQ